MNSRSHLLDDHNGDGADKGPKDFTESIFQQTNHRECDRWLTESGSFAHAKHHDLQYGRARKQVVSNRASAKDQGDVKEPPDQTSPDHSNDDGSRSGVLGASNFLTDMPVNELEYRRVLNG